MRLYLAPSGKDRVVVRRAETLGARRFLFSYLDFRPAKRRAGPLPPVVGWIGARRRDQSVRRQARALIAHRAHNLL